MLYLRYTIESPQTIIVFSRLNLAMKAAQSSFSEAWDFSEKKTNFKINS